MLTKTNGFIAAVAVAYAIFSTSCTHRYYAPNGQNVTLFKEKGEVQIAAGPASGGESSGANIQAGYAATNHLGITANAYLARGENEDNGANGNGFVMEAGAGYFNPIGEHFVFEAYGGFGGGNIYNGYADNSSSKVKFFRPYVQPAFGFTSPYFDAAFAPRIAMLNYLDIERNGTITDTKNVQDLNYIDANKTVFMFEPGITLRAGWKYIKVQAQYVWSVNINAPALRQDDHNISLGLFFNFAPRYSGGSKASE